MPLLAYNKTTSALLLAAGNPAPTLPASTSAGARGPAMNVTGELSGLTAANYTSIQAQVTAGSVEFEWTTVPEYLMVQTSGSWMEVGGIAAEVAEEPVTIYVNGGTGSDSNLGTATSPLATFIEAHKRLPLTWKKSCHVIMDADNVGRSYSTSTSTLGKGLRTLGPMGPDATPLTIIGGSRQTLITQAGGPGALGTNNTFNAVVPTGTVATDGGTTLTLSGVVGVFPTNGGVIQIASEIIKYTAEAAGVLSGLTRAYCNTVQVSQTGNTAFLFMAGHQVTFTSGTATNLAQRRQIKSNTASSITLNTNLGAVVAATDGFLVDRVATTLDISNWRTGVMTLGLKDLILPQTAATGFYASIGGGQVNMEGCDIRPTGNAFLFFGGTQWNTASVQFLADGNATPTFPYNASNPFPAVEINCGNRVECTLVGSSLQLRGNAFLDTGLLTLINTKVLVQFGSVWRDGDNGGTVLTAHGGEILVDAGGYMGIGGSAATNKALLNRCPVIVQGNATLSVVNADMNNAIYTRSLQGSAGSFVFSAGNVTLTDANAISVFALYATPGQSVTITGATSGGNNGTFVITARTATTLVYANASGVSEAFTGQWSIDASALMVQRSAQAMLTNVSGTTSSRYGLEAADLGNVRINDVLTTVTGTLGDMKSDSMPTRTWANFNAGTDNLPIQKEDDGAGTVIYGPSPASTGLSRLANYTTAGLPAASAVASGTEVFDTTAGVIKVSNGTSWLAPSVDNPVFTNGTRPAANTVVAGYSIFNSDDNAPNYSDGTNWRDAIGNIT